MADEKKRIVALTETTEIGTGDYIAMDSEGGGTKKIKASHFTGGSGNVMWGGIQGDLSDQTDLAAVLDGLREDVDNKANINGYYDELTAGSAEQLLSNTYIPDNTPYLFRTSGGSLEIGDRVYEDAIVGGSVAWNQLVNKSTDFSLSNATGSTVDGVCTFTASAQNGTAYKSVSGASLVNHVLLGKISYKTTIATNDVDTRIFSTTVPGTATTNWQTIYLIAKATTTSAKSIGVRDKRESDWDAIQTKDVMICDLTLMFGSTIADYAYTLEQSEAGSGIAWLKSQGFFGKGYYERNTGSIQSVKTSAKKVVGFNQYNNTTGKATLLGGKEYQITGAYTALAYSTGETITPDANGKFTPSADGELTVTGGNGTTTCVHLVWDGERDGEYEPYVEHTYPLDSDLELRGIPKLDSSNKLYYDGDTYASDGTVTRRYGIVDLGTLDWNKINDYSFASTTMLTNIKNKTANIINEWGSPIVTSWSAFSSSATDSYTCYVENGILYIRVGTYESGAAFKTAMSGIYLVYKLATATSEIADPYTNPQIVSNWGTEQFVDERNVPIPVGHDSRYLPDLKAKLESVPNNPSVNGKYFLQYENGQATYVPVPSEVPQTPSEDGTYILKATVSSGVATLAWVAEE